MVLFLSHFNSLSWNLARRGGRVATNIQMCSLFPWHVYLKPCHAQVDEHMSLSRVKANWIKRCLRKLGEKQTGLELKTIQEYLLGDTTCLGFSRWKCLISRHSIIEPEACVLVCARAQSRFHSHFRGLIAPRRGLLRVYGQGFFGLTKTLGQSEPAGAWGGVKVKGGDYLSQRNRGCGKTSILLHKDKQITAY